MTTNRIKTILFYVQERYGGGWIRASVKYNDLEDAKWSLVEIIDRYPQAELRVVKEIVITTTEIKVIST